MSRLWRVKIQDKELLYVQPHLTIWKKAIRWRWGLRTRSFLDPKPAPSDVPQKMLDLIEKDYDELCRRWDLSSLVAPFSAFVPTANGVKPDWNYFSVTDYGHTLRLGRYEAASDALLYEYDEEFRRRQNAYRDATEQTLGASIRGLRKQKGLTRDDFPGINPKTLTRVERTKVARPQAKTLALIAKRLGVAPSELGTF